MITDAPRAPVPDSYWVAPGSIAAGEYPGTRFRETTREKLGRLLNAGSRSFIDLTEEDELRPYSNELEEIAAARGIQVRYFRMPIRDLDVPSEALLACGGSGTGGVAEVADARLAPIGWSQRRGLSCAARPRSS